MSSRHGIRTRDTLNEVMRVRARNFSSNDYCGLSQHPRVIEAFQQAAQRYGVGGESSYLVAGYTDCHQEFERAFAEFVNRPAALLFATGYMANLGVLSVLADQHTTVIADKLIHASLVDAIQLARATLLRYPHLDHQRLAALLAQKATDKTLVVTDSVFSMHGDIAPIADIAALARQSKATLLVDDAHGIGVLGARGAGICDQFDLSLADVPVLICPLAKAFGVMGAMVTGSSELIDALVQAARPYTYTSALPPALAAAGLASLRLVQTETWRREKLQALIQFTQQRGRELGLSFATSSTPIQPLRIADANQALWLSEQLRAAGYLVKAIRPPTVPVRDICLRLSLTALHEQHDIEQLLQTIRRLCDAMPT